MEQKQDLREQNTFPWEELQKVGVNPEKLTQQDKENLQQGKRTGLIQFSIEDSPSNRERLEKEKVDYTVKDNKLNFEGKATAQNYTTIENNEENKQKLKQHDIEYKEEGNRLKLDNINARKLFIAAVTVVYPVAGVAIMICPKRKEIKNDFGFTKEELKALNNNQVVAKNNENGIPTLYQKDKDTNEIVSVRANEINIPNKIGGVELTPMQKENLKNGKEITLYNEELNQSAKIRLDLNAKNGIQVQDGEAKKQDIKITDRDRLKFIAEKGAAGIDELFKEKQSEKQEFLKKHNLSQDYERYTAINKEYSNAKTSNQKEEMRGLSTKLETIDAAIKNTAIKEGNLGLDMVYSNANKQRTGMKL